MESTNGMAQRSMRGYAVLSRAEQWTWLVFGNYPECLLKMSTYQGTKNTAITQKRFLIAAKA
jgi:hypothetical protein